MTEPLPTADGIVERAPDGSTTVRFDRRLRHPVEPVWEALTDPDELRSWWGDTELEPVEVRRTPGAGLGVPARSRVGVSPPRVDLGVPAQRRARRFRAGRR
jgi:hypothetical protein